MSDIKKQSDSDRALARLLAEVLRAPDSTGTDQTCPDAGLLAAYAEHNLDATETAHCEAHFAGCARCQKILAVLTVSGEEPLSEAEVEGFGRKVAAAALGAAGPELRAPETQKVTLIVRPWIAWRWLAPAVGIAAAAALWIALRPAPPRGIQANIAQKAIAKPSAAPGDSLEAKAVVPAPPAAASSEAVPGPPEAQQLKSLAEVQPQKKESDQAANLTQAQQQSVAQADSTAAASQARDLQRAAAPVSAENSPEATVTEESPIAAATAPPAPAQAAQRSAAPAARAAAPAPASGAEAKSAENRQVQTFAARGAVAGLVGRVPVVLASPNRDVLWRLSPGGRIERSADQGRTWQEQSSGVTSDLLAGAAPLDTAAWIAGRVGVILRTTDGEHWQRVPSPDAAADWTGIEASDALHATIVSADRRRFATEDGGQTWKQQ